MLRLSFHGATETVTGSKYLLETDRAQVLFDCGLFQGLKHLRELNWRPPPYPPRQLESIVLTHAHLDHTGYLPRMAREGFNCPIYCTPATAELTELILLDSAKIQEEDANYANRSGYSKHKPALPLYTARDAQAANRLLDPRPGTDWFRAADEVFVKFHDAGHLLGSASLEVEVRQPKRTTRILFSGDVGRYDAPLYYDPSPPVPCDVLICESTYGDREHPEDNLLDELALEVNRTIARGGVLVAACFAVGRAQQLIYLLNVLMLQNRIPEIPIYLDSPMAVDATEIYCRFADLHDLSEGDLGGMEQALMGPHVHLSKTVDESRAINAERGPAVILSSSGMMTNGRILHHLRHRLPEPRNTILVGGFQAAGTRGRSLLDGAPYLRIHGQDVPVRAQVSQISGLSGHAGRSELLRWLKDLPRPRKTFLTHGEKSSAQSFAVDLRKKGWDVEVPRLGQVVDLEKLLSAEAHA